MRAATLCLMLGFSIAYAGCTVDARDNNPAESGGAGATQDSTDPGTTTGDDTATSTSNVRRVLLSSL